MKIDDQRNHAKKIRVKDLEVRDTFETGGFILTKMSDEEYYDVQHCVVYTRGGGMLLFNNGEQCKFYGDLAVGLLNAAMVIRAWGNDNEATDPSGGSKRGGEPWTHKGRPARLTAPKRPGTSAKPSPGRFY